ncbi:MFS transporter [Streptomyces sp. NPDC056161]|uniref:MFS transporter n=1 Tax=Streptomyces sp. NPDC056161 TaxID=3345732 RepID=UPI0035E3720A
MSAESRPSLETIINDARTSRFQVLVIAVCVAVMVLDGYDTQSISFAAPAIAAAWHVSPSSFGFVFGIGLFGGLVGAITSGVVADRFGRKPTLVCTVALFGLGSLVTPLADSMTTLGVIRFVTGLGVGGALPGAIAIAAEYASERARAAVATIAFCGIPLGSVIGSVLASHLIPDSGWGSIFVVGGLIPLLLVPCIIAFVPESVRFLSLRQDDAAIIRLLTRMGIGEREAARVRLEAAEGPRKVPVRDLFTEGRAVGTSLLSLALFLTLLMAFFLVNWIPTVATAAGIGSSAAILSVASLNLGGIVGSFVITPLSRRFPPGAALGAAYTLGAAAIALIGQAGTSGTWLLITTFVAGFLAIGAQMCTVSLVATYYDTSLRGTGVGWAMGCGRVGGIIGPTVGGRLIAASFDMSALFVVVSVVSAACAVTVLALGRFALRPAGRPPRKTAVPTPHTTG